MASSLSHPGSRTSPRVAKVISVICTGAFAIRSRMPSRPKRCPMALGCFLSGGTDSSTVAGTLKQVTGSAATFSIGFDAAGYDEMDYARIAAKHFGTDHHEHYVTPAELVSAIPKVAAHYDQPFGNSSAVPAYICATVARDHGVRKLLAGDGGDELFGGNTRYAKQKIFEAWWVIACGGASRRVTGGSQWADAQSSALAQGRKLRRPGQRADAGCAWKPTTC